MRLRRDQTLQQLSAMLPELRARFDVRELGIFGSVARDEATLQSDLDVIVDFNSSATFMNFMRLREYLETAFGSRVDLLTYGALQDRLRSQIETEVLRVA
jgi:hypothetical protein